MSWSVSIPTCCRREISNPFEEFATVATALEVHAFAFKKFTTYHRKLNLSRQQDFAGEMKSLINIGN